MDQIVQFFEKLITEFTWRRFGFLMALAFVAIVTATFYELYTGHFRFTRIERATALLEQLNEQALSVEATDNETASEIHAALMEDLADYVSPEPTQLAAPNWMLKAAAAAAPWFLLAVLFYFVTDDEYGKLLGGLLVVAIPLSFVGAVLPDFEREWLNFVAYPVGSLLIVIVPMFLYGRKSKTST